MSEGKQFALVQAWLIRLIQDGTYPDWVEAEFADAQGKIWTLVEKAPVLFAEELDVQNLPSMFWVDCLVLEQQMIAGESLTRITLEEPYGVTDREGHSVECWINTSQLRFASNASMPAQKNAPARHSGRRREGE